MIKKSVAVVFATAILSTAALAAEGDFMKADGNTDGALSYQEVLSIMPSVTTDQFKGADADGNGTLSQAEFAAISS